MTRIILRAESLLRKRVAVAACAGLMLGVVVRGGAQDGGTRDPLEQLKQSLTKTIEDDATNAAVYDTNGFHLESAEVA